MGGGVTLSIVAGMFTFGVGTVVGLAVTSVAAAGTVAAGAGAVGVASVGSHLLARNFDKIQQTFQSICEDLDMLNKNVANRPWNESVPLKNLNARAGEMR